MAIRRTEKVSLDSLAAEKLPATIVEAIDDIAVGLETIETEVYIGVRKGKLIAQAQVHLPVRKTLIIIGIVVAIWLAFPDLQVYIPLLLALMQKM